MLRIIGEMIRCRPKADRNVAISHSAYVGTGCAPVCLRRLAFVRAAIEWWVAAVNIAKLPELLRKD